MGHLSMSFPWTYRAIPMLMILAALYCMVLCSQSPGAPDIKSYPRGNHWAVGHLMGRKSVEMLPEPDSDYPPTSLERRDAALDQQYPSRTLQKTRWRGEVRLNYLREIPDLFLGLLKKT